METHSIEVDYLGELILIDKLSIHATDADILAGLVNAGIPDLDGGTIVRSSDGTIKALPPSTKNGKKG